MTPLEAMATALRNRHCIEQSLPDLPWEWWMRDARAALDALEANVSEGMIAAAARQIEDIELHMTEREVAENPEELTDYDAGDIARVVIATAIQRAKEEG